MNAKLKTPKCSRCRTRKIRCNGKNPCFSCSKLSRRCEYDVTKSELPMRKGAACFECRKRCDGRLPCQTCSVGRREIHCAYPDGDIAIVPPGELQAIVVATSSLSPDGVGSGQQSGSLVPVQSPIVTPPASLADPGSSRSDDLYDHPPWTIEGAHGLNPATIISLSILTAENPSAQPSSQSLSALSLTPVLALDTTYYAHTSRTLFFNHRIQLGLCVSENTVKALSQGLTDTDSLHPVLLRTTQLIGFMLARRHQYILPHQRELEEEQTRRILNSFDDPDVKPCPVGYLQTCSLLSIYFCNQGDIVRAREMLVIGNTIVHMYNIDTMALDPRSSGDAIRDEFKANPATQRGVAQAALSQLLYLDLTYTIILKLPSIIDARLRANFKTLISRPNPSSEINFLRAKSAFLLIEAQLLAARWYRHRMDEQEAEQWQRSYWDLMDALQAHHSFLNLTLTKLVFNPDLQAVKLSLKVCAVLVLIARLALLCPFREQLDIRLKKCECMTEIINISKSFSEEDCQYLDPLLSVCWTATIEMLEQCIARGSEVALYDLPAMVGIIRQQYETLERVLPVTVAH